MIASLSLVGAGDLDALRAVATLLLPGDGDAPAAGALPDFDGLITRALAAVGKQAATVMSAVGRLPQPLTWESLGGWANNNPADFEVLSTVVAGAYFMSVTALEAIGYPHGARRRAPHDQAAEELGYGLLDPMIDRISTLREVPA